MPVPTYSLAPTDPPTAYSFDAPDWADTVLGLGRIGNPEPSPDGGMIAVQFGAGLAVLHADTLTPIWFNPGYVETYPELIWSPDSSRIAVVENFKVSILDSSNGEHLYSQTLPDEAYAPTWRDAAWSPDGKYVALRSLSSTSPMILEANTGAVLMPLGPDDIDMYSSDITWSTDSSRLAWSVNSKNQHQTIISSPTSSEPIKTFPILATRWAPDLSLFEVSDIESSLWNAETGQGVLSPEVYLAESPDWTTAVSVGPGRVTAWSLPSGSELWTLTDINQSPFWATFSPDGKTITVVSGLSVTAYDADSGEPRFTLPNVSVLGKSPDLAQVADQVRWSSDSRSLITSVYGDSGFTIRDAATGNVKQVVLIDDQPRKIAFLPNRSEDILFLADTRLAIWNMGSQQTTGQITSTYAQDFSWSSDSKSIDARNGDGSITTTWDVDTGECVSIGRTPLGSDMAESSLRRESELVSPDGLLIGEGGEQNVTDSGETRFMYGVSVRDAKTDEVVFTDDIRMYTDAPRVYLAWSPDSRFMAANGEVVNYIWDVREGREIYHSPQLNMDALLAFSPDSSMLGMIVNGAVYIIRLDQP